MFYFLVIWAAYILKKMKSVFSLTLLLFFFFLSMTLVSLLFGSLFYYTSPPRLSLHRVGILLPPSLLGRAPSRGSHGLSRRTADRVSLCLSLLSWLPLPGISLLHDLSLPTTSCPVQSDLQACAKPALRARLSINTSFDCM